MADNVFKKDPLTLAYDRQFGTPDQPPEASIDPLVEIERFAVQSQVPANILVAISEQVAGDRSPLERVAVAQRTAEQLAPYVQQGKSIEDVVYGAFSDPEHGKSVLARAREVQQQWYPERDPFENEGAGRLAKRRGQQYARGATEVAASIPEAGAIQAAELEGNVKSAPERRIPGVEARIASLQADIEDPETPEPLRQKLRERIAEDEALLRSLRVGEVKANQMEVVPASERDTFKAGDRLREASAELFGAPDPRDTGFWAQVAEGGGNMTVLAATAILTGPAGMPTGATLGAAMNQSQLYKEALDAGATEEVAMRASKWGAAIGATEIIPIGRALNLLPPRLRQKIGGRVMKRFADIAQGAGEEAAQEYLATVANNMVASGMYDPERGWTDGAVEAALVGAVLGGGMGGLGTALDREDRARDVGNAPLTPPPERDEEPETAPEGPETTAGRLPTRKDPEAPDQAPARAAEGPLARAAEDAPDALADFPPGAPVTVEAGPTSVQGTFVRETPGAVVVKDEEGTELEIPREEFETGGVSIAARVDDETKDAPAEAGAREGNQSQATLARDSEVPRLPDDGALVELDPRDLPDWDEISGMAERTSPVYTAEQIEDVANPEKPEDYLRELDEQSALEAVAARPPIGQNAQNVQNERRPTRDYSDQYAGLPAEEALRRAQMIEDLAKVSGWTADLLERRRMLMTIADGLDVDIPPPAPMPILKRDGSAFASAATARRAIENRGANPADYVVEPRDGGFVAVPAAEARQPVPEPDLLEDVVEVEETSTAATIEASPAASAEETAELPPSPPGGGLDQGSARQTAPTLGDTLPDDAPNVEVGEDVSRETPPEGAFMLGNMLSDTAKKTLAESRTTNDDTLARVGELVGELDAAARRADAQKRAEKAKGNDGQQPSLLVDEAAALAQSLLHNAKGATWPDFDDATGEYEPGTGSPFVEAALGYLDTFEAMGTWTDTVDPDAGTGFDANAAPAIMSPEEVFPNTGEKTANLNARAGNMDVMSIEAAQARVQEWKDAAIAQGKTGQNANKLVISLFDYTGAWSQPYVDAGFQVIRHDIKTGSDLLRDAWIMEQIEEHRKSGVEVYGVLSACPCTTFSGAGARWWKERHDVKTPEALAQVFGEQALSSGAKSPLEYNVMLAQATKDLVAMANPSAFHALENPVGRIEAKADLPPPAFRFHPHNFGDPYTKYTAIFGDVNADLPFAPVDPVEGSKMQAKLRGDNALDKEARSTTPEGFAYAFFMANNPKAAELREAAPGAAIAAKPDSRARKSDNKAQNADKKPTNADTPPQQSLKEAVAAMPDEAFAEMPRPLMTGKSLGGMTAREAQAVAAHIMTSGKPRTGGFFRMPGTDQVLNYSFGQWWGKNRVKKAADFLFVNNDRGQDTFYFKIAQLDKIFAKEEPGPTSEYPFKGQTIYRGSGGANTARNGVSVAGEARYFALTEEAARAFGETIEASRLDLANPLVLQSDDDWRKVTREAGWDFPNIFDETKDQQLALTKQLKETVRKKGHDGLIVDFPASEMTDENPATGKSIKLLRNMFDIPQVVDYRTPKVPTREEIDAAAAETDPNPTDAQKEAENYKTGKIRWQGLELSIENAEGSERSGVDGDGKPWSVTMPADYGRILKTEGADGDHVDFYMGPDPESNTVVIVNQNDAETGKFDEHKVILGTSGVSDALKIYRAGFSDGKADDRLGSYNATDVESFKGWLKDQDTTKPVPDDDSPLDTKPVEDRKPAKASDKGTDTSRKSAPKVEPEKPASTYGAKNTLVSADRAAELRAKLKAKLDGSQLNAGIDPELLSMGAELAVFHIEAGSRKFLEFSQAIAADLGTTPKALKKYLRSWYNGARDMMEDNDVSIEGMDGPDRVATILSSGAIDVVAASQPDLFAERSSDTIEKSQPEAEADDNPTDAGDGGQSPRESARDPEEGSGGAGSLREEPGRDGSAGSEPAKRARKRSERPQDSGRDSVRDSTPGSAGAAPSPRNHVVEPGDLTPPRGEKTRARRSIDAIRTMKTLESEGRPATEAERQTLAGYGGAGTLASALPRSDGTIKFGDLHSELKDMLTEAEYATLSRTSQYAFYTAEPVVRSMWQLASRLGVADSTLKPRVFEPGMGVGNFAGTMQKPFHNASYRGIELDHITASIAKALYPNHEVAQGDFIETKLPHGYYDLVIGNPPFASTKVQADPDYPQRFMLHDYFFAKSIDSVRPGGLLAFVTSAGTMNKQDSAARDYLADRADLVGAIRLPNTAFEEQGTNVTTDIVVLQKRAEGQAEADPSWRTSTKIEVPDRDGGTGEAFVNKYFQDHPEMILGEQGLFETLQGSPRIGVRPKDGADLQRDLYAALESFPKNIVSNAAPAEQLGALDTEHVEKKAGTYYLKDGELHQHDGITGKKVDRRSKENPKGMPKAAMETVKALIPVRDALRDVYAADVNGNGSDAARKRLNEAYDAFTAKRGPIGLQQRQERRPSVVEQESARQQAYEDARNAGEAFDIGSFDPSHLFAEGKSLAAIARARNEARANPNYREGDFDPDSMPSKILVKRPNVDAFMDDPESYRLLAIEDYDEKTDTAKKTRVFKENAVKVTVEPEINSPEDALLHVLAETGKVDLDQIAKLSGSDARTVREELGDKVFENPVSKEFETRSKYLSGNVRNKLAEARAAANKASVFNRNVAALEEVQPAIIPHSEIRVPLGAHWFESSIYTEFADSLGLRLNAAFTPALGMWRVSGDENSSAAVNTWGTTDVPFAKLMATVMNNKKIEVRRTPKGKPSYVDDTATQAAIDKATELQAKFSEWLWSDEGRRADLEDTYNAKFNAEVAPEYDGGYLTTPGINADWNWRPHQTAVIARNLQSGNTYMAHTVGAGKTSAMIGTGMEGRRLGIMKKPMYVVPNHMLVQFTTEFYQQYPLAKILVADEKRFHTSRRKQFVADAALGDWDAIIITHSAFGKIPASEASRLEAIETMVSDLKDVLESVDESDRGADRSILSALGSVASIAGIDVKTVTDGQKKTRKKIEALIEAAEQRIKRQTSDAGKDQVFDFDELGVDQLFVDEAHLFRKLSFATTNGNIKGIDPAGSQASMDLFVKTRAIEKKTPGRGLTFASGTPITNTMAELYSISRYLQPDALKERGLEAFDAWAATFGETGSDLEQTPDGGYKQVARFAKFVNTPELSLMVRQVMDVVSSSDLDQYVTRPKLKGGSRKLIVVEPDQEVKAYQRHLGTRMAAIEKNKGPVKKGDDILLSVINDGRMSAIDLRLVADEAAKAGIDVEGGNSKLERMISEVATRWKGGAKAPLHGVKPGGGYTDKPIETGPTTQIVFSTLGINGTKHNPGFSVHRYVRSRLVAAGVPASDIIIAEDLKTDALKQRAFNDMNEGKKRILIGSKNLFTGVNAQRRIAAIHNLDPLWFPADDEQRNGRGLRQGNMNPEIEILDYTTKGTYDATMWQMMARKAAFIEAFYRGDPTVREIEDLGEASAYDQAKAMSTADPRVLKLSELKSERDVLERRRKAAENQEYRLRSSIRSREGFVKDQAPELKRWTDLANQVESTQGDAFKAKVGATEFDNRKEFGSALLALANKAAKEGEAFQNRKVGSISGFPIEADFSQALGETELYVVPARGDEYGLAATEDPVGLARSVERVLMKIEAMPGRIQENIDRTKAKAEADRTELGRLKGFAEQDKLDRLNDEVVALEDELLADTEKKEKSDPEPDAGPDAKALRNPDGWGEVEGDAPMSQADIDAVTKTVQAELKRVGIAARVEGRAVESLAVYGEHPTARGLYTPPAVEQGGKVAGLRVKADDQNVGDVLNHEVIHALRDADLWGNKWGLFTEKEWKALVRASRADKDIAAFVDAEYADYPPSMRAEERVAEMYRKWRAQKENTATTPGVKSGLEKISEILKAMAKALRSIGRETPAKVFERIESGEFGKRADRAAAPAPIRGTGIAKLDKALRADQAPSALQVAGLDKASERKRIGQILTDAMGGQVGLLSLVPGRALFAELGKKIPSARTYLRFKEEMDAERQEWHASTDEVAQAWRKLIRKNGKANKQMMQLMHDATRAGQDPSENFKPKLKPEEADILEQAKPGTHAFERAAIIQEQDVGRKERHESLQKRFDKLPPEFQAMFRRVRNEYSRMGDAFEQAVIENVKKSMQVGLERAKRRHAQEMDRIRDEGLEGTEKAEAKEAADARLADAKRRQGWSKGARMSALRAQFESNRIDGPYFPLQRFGRFFMTIRSKDSGKVLEFSRFESERAQQAAMAEARKLPDVDVEGGVIDEKMNWRDQVDPGFVADVEEMLGGELGAGGANVMDMIWQRWLETLPDYSVRTSRIHRKGTPGFDDDAFRAFGRQMFHGSHQLARLKHAMDMQNALEEAKEEAQRTSDPNRNGLIVTEMEKRHDFVMNPTGSSVAQAATSAAFVYYLGVTPSAAAVNLSQTTVVGIPVLKAGTGASTAQTAKALGGALSDFTRGKGEAQKSSRITRDEWRAMNEAYRRGVVDRTQSHDLAGVAETGVEYSDVRTRVMGKVSWFFHHAERLNREVTFLAAYRLSRAKGLDHDQAIEKGADLTWKSHFDYQNTSRPRLMQNDTAKVLLVFRNFQINMLWRLFRDTHQAFRGDTPEARREARAQVIGISAMMMLQAGITGVWGYALLTFMASLIFGMGRDEVEEEVKRATVELFGPQIGGMVLKGVPGHVTGTDLTQRIGMPELWFRSSDRILEGDDVYNYWLTEMVGAAAGIVENQVRGIQKIGDGEVWRGVETMAPKFIRDIMQATRFMHEGVQTYNGDPLIEEMNWRQIIIEAMGFTPAQLSERYEMNTRMKNAEKRINKERRGILKQIREDMKADGITEKTMQKLRDFNKEYPSYPITAATIRRSLSAARRASARNEFGIQLNPKLNRRIRGDAAPSIYN